MAWNGSDGAAKPQKIERKAKPSAWRGLLAAVIVIGGAVGVCLYFFGPATVGGQRTKKKDKSAKIAEVTPDIATNSNEVAEIAPTHTKRVITPEEQKKLRPGDEGFDPSAHPTILIPKKKDKPLENLPYRNSTEQTLLWIANCEPGDPPLPLLAIPQGDMAKMAEILIDKCEEEEGDTEFTKEQRERLRYAKEEMAAYIRDGGDPQSFLKYYHDQLEAMHLERSIALDSVMTLLREGGNDDIAEEYLHRINKQLEAKGIKPIILSKKKMERHGITSNTENTEEQQ